MDTVSNASYASGWRRSPTRQVSRRCRFEQLEQRQLLAADLTSGVPNLTSGTTGGRSGEIRGTVYASQQGGCESHSTDSALDRVRMQLLDDRGQVLEETLTDQDGRYAFADLLAGQYAVRQVTSHGYLDGAAVVGTGGGIALGTNLVGEIIVQPGQALAGYDFCDVENSPEPSGPTDYRIVPHQHEDLIVMPFQIPTPFQSTVAEQGILNRPKVEWVVANASVPLAPLGTGRPADVFGGSSHVLADVEELKTWDEYLFDDLFAHTSFLELANESPSQSEVLETLMAEIDASNNDPFADGYTANTVEWSANEPLLDLEMLIGDGELIHVGGEQPPNVNPPTVEKIARREKVE